MHAHLLVGHVDDSTLKHFVHLIEYIDIHLNKSVYQKYSYLSSGAGFNLSPLNQRRLDQRENIPCFYSSAFTNFLLKLHE